VIIEVSAIYKADRKEFHMDDVANAIFKAHGGKWVDQGTIYGNPNEPMHLDRNITCEVQPDQVAATKAELHQAGFRVRVQEFPDGWEHATDADVDAAIADVGRPDGSEEQANRITKRTAEIVRARMETALK
jgi:hypothetical protein